MRTDKSKRLFARAAQLLPGGNAFLFDASDDNNVWEDATIQVQRKSSCHLDRNRHIISAKPRHHPFRRLRRDS